MEVFMNCVFCGNEIAGRPIRLEGQVYCSSDCVETVAEVGNNDDEYGMEEDQDESMNLDYYEEVDEY